MRHLGIDYGSKKIGLALSDESGTMGFPHSIIANTAKAVENICALVAKEDVRALVIGESVDYQGKANPIAKDAKTLGEEVATRCGVPVFYEWEGMTSAEARRLPAGRQAHTDRKSRAPQKHPRVDASAAALILTSYLSRHSHG